MSKELPLQTMRLRSIVFLSSLIFPFHGCCFSALRKSGFISCMLQDSFFEKLWIKASVRSGISSCDHAVAEDVFEKQIIGRTNLL